MPSPKPCSAISCTGTIRTGLPIRRDLIDPHDMTSGDDPGFGASRLSLTITIPAEPKTQDEVVIIAVAPIARGLQDLPGDHEFDFERLNKPSWRVGLTLRGAGEWLEEVGRPFLEERLAKAKARGDIPG